MKLVYLYASTSYSNKAAVVCVCAALRLVAPTGFEMYDNVQEIQVSPVSQVSPCG